MTPPSLTNFENFLLKWWWVILFAFLCGTLYEQVVKKRDKDFAKLSEQLAKLEAEKALAAEQQKELLQNINSQSDSNWVELVLMQKLGVVPEGQKKFFFQAK